MATVFQQDFRAKIRLLWDSRFLSIPRLYDIPDVEAHRCRATALFHGLLEFLFPADEKYVPEDGHYHPFNNGPSVNSQLDFSPIFINDVRPSGY